LIPKQVQDLKVRIPQKKKKIIVQLIVSFALGMDAFEEGEE
jgi:hypothetical protein